ncbi:MAG TPA: winged helix-turn-helix domain-containing protein [Candidatus Thermoplasmatota archaeon]|nr:winged helix-turn-helix domain-containing protein [Candidatus Thermoplasmatota archaeon]
MLGGRRSSLDIIHAVLRLVDEGERKTRIMTAANLSHELLTRYLGFLVDGGFVLPREGGAYRLTPEGRSLLDDVGRVRRRLAGGPACAPGLRL